MNKKLNILYPREYVDKEGRGQTHWMNVGIAWASDDHGDLRIDAKLYVMPPAVVDDKNGYFFKLKFREPDRDDQEREAAYRARSGGRAPPRYEQQGQGPRPPIQHRDQLRRDPPPAQFGPPETTPDGDDGNLPF